MLGGNTAEQQLQPYPQPREHLLWSGRPAQGLRFSWPDLYIIPFSVMWFGGVLFMVGFALWALIWSGSEANLSLLVLFLLLMVPFVAMGAYIALGRIWLDSKLRSSTFCGITEDQIHILRHFPKTTHTSLDIKRLPALSVDTNLDGRGNVEFHFSNGSYSSYHDILYRPWFPWLAINQRFDSVEDARMVYDLIQKQARDS